MRTCSRRWTGFRSSTLSDPLRIQKLRVIEVAVSRNGKPSDAAVQKVIADVDAVFPGSSFELNTEMSQILSAFNAPTAIEKTMRLMEQTKIYEEQFAYRYNMRSVTAGGRPSIRRNYFKWFNEDHNDDQHRYDYREWFNRVNQQPRIAGNAPYLAGAGRRSGDADRRGEGGHGAGGDSGRVQTAAGRSWARRASGREARRGAGVAANWNVHDCHEDHGVRHTRKRRL